MHSELAKLKQQSTNQPYRLTKKFIIMRKIFFLVAFLSASIMSFAEDVNFALASQGSSATASSGDAGAAIDGNQGTRWESAQTDAEWFLLDMGQSRTFNYFKINWEGAYAKQFQLLASADGETFSPIYTESNLDHSGWQKIYLETAVTARYIKYQGIERATQWGQSFYEFEVYYLSEAPKTYTQIEGLTIVAASEGYNDVNRVLDGNAGTEWQGSPTNGTDGDEAARTFDAWFVVDLGGLYDVDKVDIHFEGACAQDYHLDFSEDNTNWALGYNFVGDQGVYGRTDEVTELNNNTKVRYVRFWSTKAATQWGMKIFEFRVYGAAWVPAADTEKPVMVSASLVSKNYNSAVIAVSATDDNEVAKYRVVDLSQSFDAYFAPTNGEITVTGLNPNTAYYFLIYAVDVVNKESEYSKAVGVTTDVYASEPAAACAAPTWPADQVKAIYSPTYNADCGFGEWGSGTQVSDTEYGKKYVLAGGGYFGMVDFAINALIMDTLHFDIWIAEDATIGVVPIWGGDEQRVTVSLKGQQWNSINIAKEQYTAITDWSNIYQVKIDQASNLTFWVGNAYFYRAEPIVDDEAPTNVQASAAGSGYFSATLAVSAEDNSGVVNYRVMNGETEVANGGGASGQTVHITVPNLKANTEYTFSVVAADANNNLAAPVNVQVSTLAAPAPATLPTYDAADVKGVYTDNYTDVAMGIQGWYVGPAISAGDLAENREALCITPNTTAGSCFGLAFPPMDITAYDALELDIYPMAESAVLDIQVIGAGDASTTFNLTANEWNHISLNIDGNTKTDCEQIGFYNCQNLQGVCFVQNVLFVQNGDTTAIENTEVGPKAIKMIENGQLIIIRDGKRYNVTGVRVQ